MQTEPKIGSKSIKIEKNDHDGLNQEKKKENLSPEGDIYELKLTRWIIIIKKRQNGKKS